MSSRRSLLGRIAVLPVVGLLPAVAAGCTPTPIPAEGPATSSANTAPDRSRRDEQHLADQLVASVQAGDVAAYRLLLGGGDTGFAATADQLWRNLAALTPTQLSLTVSARREPVPASRRLQLSADALATETNLTWAVEGQPAPAQTTIWMTFTGSGDSIRLAGTQDRPAQAATVPVPIWWRDPIEVDRGAGYVLLRDPSVSPPHSSSWAEVAARAITQARRRVPTTATGAALIQLPGSAVGLSATTGQPAATKLAALTISAGPDPATAPAQVVLNPDLASQSVDRAGFVLTHELVHVLLDAPARPAPLWVEEGTADAVAFDAYPSLAATELATLVRRLHGRAPVLPGDGAFAPGAADLDQIYLRAWSACRYLVERRDWATLLEVGAQLAADPRRDWWTAAGFATQLAFQRGWAAWLTRQKSR